MQRFFLALIACFAFPGLVCAQIGKSVAVAAGTPEDAALSEIYATPDGAQKIALLDKFMEQYGKGDLELLGDEIYVNTHLAQKNYAKVYEYADKVFQLDPDSLATVVAIVHAADEAGDAAKLFEAAEHGGAIVTRFKNSSPPSDVSPESWLAQRDEKLKAAQPDIQYIEYAAYSVALKSADPAARAALMERYAAAFPDSPYTMQAREGAAFAYQAAQNYPKMLDAAQKILAADPNNVAMLLLLADNWSEKGQQLDAAAQDAQKALDLLAQAKKPEQMSDEQWKNQTDLQKGLAYSALGQIYVTRGRNAQAVDAFRQAAPLLKSNSITYGRNQYRLGFTLAKMKRTAEARVVLTEAASIDSPYKPLAQDTLAKIGGPVREKR